MDVQAIFDALAQTEDLPRACLRAASEQRDELTSPLIAEIERYLEAGPEDRPSGNCVFFAFLLLGEWGAQAAYRTLARLLRLPSDEIEAALGDGAVDASHRVIAAVFDGDPQPIYEIIRDVDADEFVRSRMCEALAMLAVSRRLARDEVIDFLRTCFDDLKPARDNYVWNGWQSAIAMLGAEELTLLVKEAFRRGSVDEDWLALEHFERDLAHALAKPDAPWRDNDGRYEFWGNTVEELSKWYGYSEQYKQDQERRRSELVSRLALAVYGRATKRVGRNEACPCGSGRKFKKCCAGLNVAASLGVSARP